MDSITRLNVADLLTTLGLVVATPSPWAIILVKFSDQNDAWPPLSKYEDLFTSAGTGKMNMVDFFGDVSHGKIDLSGSKIFGPFTLPAKRSDYATLGRNGLLNLAKTTATTAGVDLSPFAGVCVSCLGQVDLCGWIGGMATLCDTLSLQPSLLGQEMGHGYGLDHARVYGSDQDYQDPWDVMSTANAYEMYNQEFTDVGPAMNAWEMRSRGWLDETRVWNGSPYYTGSVQLRPLHRRDLPGFLAAQVGAEYLVEFRVPQRWDAAIPRPCVLVHQFLDNHSYLMYSQSGSRDIVKGDKFQIGDVKDYYSNYYEVDVTNIDEHDLTATIQVHQRPARRAPEAGPQEIFGGVAVDGGGVVIIGGKIIKVPPRGPAFEVLTDLVRYLQVDISVNDVATALTARREALESIVRNVATLYAGAQPISEQPPGYAPSRSGEETLLRTS